MAFELIRLVHFAALFVVSATVLIHYIAFAPEITREDARNLYRVDMAFWAASTIMAALDSRAADFGTSVFRVSGARR